MANNKLKPDVKKLFIEALKSGKYKQGKSSYYDDTNDTYCVMGVYIYLYLKHIGEDWSYFDNKSKDEAVKISLHDVKDWGGIDAAEHTLISMNDDGDSFKEIAKFIEEKY
jgi:hypothetical protein